MTYIGCLDVLRTGGLLDVSLRREFGMVVVICSAGYLHRAGLVTETEIEQSLGVFAPFAFHLSSVDAVLKRESICDLIGTNGGDYCISNFDNLSVFMMNYNRQ